MVFLTKFYIFIVAIILLVISGLLAYNNKKYKRMLGILGVVYGSAYFIWRIFFTLPGGDTIGMIFSILLLVVEFVALMNTLVLKMLFAREKKIEIERNNVFETEPEVDIFIATYNESVDILKRTIVASLDVNYPKDKFKVYVGDDGRREEVKVICDEFGAVYVTRDDNEHAKAGNLNNLLKQSTAPYILTLDADMIPSREIINKMIHYFEDEKTGFVQSPQVFYNHDVFQYNLGFTSSIPNEQDFFMRTILEKRAGYNAVLHVGCNAIFSREAIANIGGIPTTSITEDMATGMLIQAKGYKSFFVNEPLAIGLAIESIKDMISQRDRWLRGTIQILKRNFPLTVKGLDIYQKMIYMDGILYWSYGLQKMIYIICPLLYLLFGIVVFDALGSDVAMMFLPYFISNLLYFRVISDDSRNVTWSHIYETTTAPYMAFSFISELLFSGNLKFRVTPKGNTSDKNSFNFRLALPHLIILILSLVSLGLNISLINRAGLLGVSSLIINVFWCLYNLLGVLVSLHVYTDRRRMRKVERMPVDMASEFLIESCDHNMNCHSCGRVTDISEKGAGILVKRGCSHFTYEPGDTINVNINNVGTFKSEIIRKTEGEEYDTLGLKFIEPGFEEYIKINRYRFELHHEYINRQVINRNANSFWRIFVHQLFVARR